MRLWTLILFTGRVKINNMKTRTEKDLIWAAIDFDDTIAYNSGSPDYTPIAPKEEIKDALEEIISMGLKVCIETSRPWHDYEMIEEFMDKWHLPFHRIICGALFAKVHIDDRAIGFRGDWHKTLQELKEYIKQRNQ